MKTKKIFLFMLLMAVSMVANAAVEYYGITIGGNPITSNYQPNPSDHWWYYDPSANILHLKEWDGDIIIDGDINPDVNISVEGRLYNEYIGTYRPMIKFKGNGNHVVYGNGGSIYLVIQDHGTEFYTLGNVGLIDLSGYSHVTFKEIDIELKSNIRFNPSLFISGFALYNSSRLTFDHCEVSINTNGGAIYNNYRGKIEIKNCTLVEGTNDGEHIVDANGNDLTSITIHKDRVRIDNLSFEVDPPVVGQPLSSTAVANGDGYYITSVNWLRVTDDNQYILEDGYECRKDETYRVCVQTILYDDYYYPSNNTLTGTINSQPADVLTSSISPRTNTFYTFPSYIKITNFSFEVDPPVVGQALNNTAIAAEEGNSVLSVYWYKLYGGNMYPLQNGYVCKLGETYQVTITSKLSDEYCFPLEEPITVTVNSKPAGSSRTMDYVTLRTSYKFPQLANTYYDLWVGGTQVTDQNKNNVLEDDDKTVRYKELLGLHYLYLENAKIKNTGNSQLEYTGYGRGIYSTMSGLSVSVKGDNTIESTGEGIYFTGNLSLLGGKDTENTLNIKGSSGIKTNSQGTALQVYNMKLTAEATSSDSGIGIGGTPSFSSNNTNCTMTVSGANTVVKASGEYLSLGRLKDLVLEDGLQIVRPSGAYFANNNVRDASGTVICGPWVVIMGDTSITTGLNEADTQSTTDQPMYNLSGQRVGKDYKGIVIQNGKKVMIK